MAIPTLTETERPTLTVKVTNVPPSVIAKELQKFLESALGEGTVYAVEIFTERENWKSRGHGRVQFETPEAKTKALSLSQNRKLLFKGFYLSITHALEEIIIRPMESVYRVGDVDGLVLKAGIMLKADCMGILESWDGVKLWVMPERKKIHFFVNREGESYKLEVQFGDVLESRGCFLGGDNEKVDAILLKVWLLYFEWFEFCFYGFVIFCAVLCHSFFGFMC